MKETYFIWVGLEGIMLKRNKSDRERQILNDITYVWNLQNDTNEPILKTETESQM